MSTLIVYATKHGSAEDCAKILGEKLQGKVDLYNIKKDMVSDLSQYDKIIIGGSIYVGKVQKEISEFCIKNSNELQKKKLGFFICCMNNKNAEDQLKNSFPEELISKAVAKKSFGGEFRFKKMNFMERFIIKKVAKSDENLPSVDTNKDISQISEDSITEFANLINNA